MSIQKKYLKAGMGYAIGNYLIYGISFITIPLFSRLMSTAEYGQYNLFLSYENIIFIIMGFALHSSYKNAKYHFKIQFNEYISSTYILSIISLLAWLFIVNITYSFWGNFSSFSRFIINLLLLYSFGSVIIQYYYSYVNLEYKYNSYLLISFLNLFSSVLLSIIFIATIYKNDTATARIVGGVIPILLLSFGIIVKQLKSTSFPKHNLTYWGYGLKYSLPIIPHGISQVILSQFDRIMINSMVGASATGIYSFAHNFYTIITLTGNSLDSVWSPWFYEQMNVKNYQNIKKRSVIYSLLMLSFCSLVMFFLPEAIYVLASTEYSDAIYVAYPMVAAAFFSFLYLIPASVEYFYSKTGYIALGTAAAAIINIILNYFGIIFFGYQAAAYTTLITYILYFIFHYVLAYRIHGSFLFPIKNALFCTAAILVVLLVAFVCRALFILRILFALLIIILTLFMLQKSKIISLKQE